MRFNHITLIVSDFERSKAFYSTLGLVQIVDAPPRYARFRFPDGDATLSVEVTGEQPATATAQLFFECDDVDATVAALTALAYGVPQSGLVTTEFDGAPIRPVGKRSLVILTGLP